jgi:hypothetical protein
VRHRSTITSLAALAAAALVGTAVPAASATTSAAAKGGTGTIKVHLVSILDHKTGIPQVKICATSKQVDPTSGKTKPGRVGGKCDTTSNKGYASLTKVPAGKWWVTSYSPTGPAGSDKRVAVRRGHTTKVTWAVGG